MDTPRVEPPTSGPHRPPCDRCDGCGEIASSEAGEPWSAWQGLPPGSDVAVRMGLVRPLPCPDCDGTGVEPLTLPPSSTSPAPAAGQPEVLEVAGRPAREDLVEPRVVVDPKADAVLHTLGGLSVVQARTSAVLRVERRDPRIGAPRFRPVALRILQRGEGGEALRLELAVDGTVVERPSAGVLVQPLDVDVAGSRFELEAINPLPRDVVFVAQLALLEVP